MIEAKKHPQWKQLMMEIADKVSRGQQIFTYQELSDMAGCNIRNHRHQFYRFRQEYRETQSLWFECVRGVGYRIIEAREHTTASKSRVNSANRRMKDAHAILTHTRLDRLNEAQLLNHVQTLSLINTLVNMVEIQNRKIDQILVENGKGTVPKDVKNNVRLIKETC